MILIFPIAVSHVHVCAWVNFEVPGEETCHEMQRDFFVFLRSPFLRN